MRSAFCLAVALVLSCSATAACAESLWFADASAYPGKVWRNSGSGGPTVTHHRLAKADRAYPNAVMKVAQIAIDVEGNLFFCSGLDNYVIRLVDGRHEILPFPEAPGQVRDVSCSMEPHTVYYSIVPTPQENAARRTGSRSRIGGLNRRSEAPETRPV